MALALLALGAILWGLAYLLAASPLALQLYRPPIGSLPAHLFAGRLAELAAAGPSGTVALIGPSTVREGFDPREMERTAPGLRFFNCGVTSQGSIPHAEMLLGVMKRFGVRPEILVLGLNSRMLARRENLLGRTGFVDLLDEADARALLPWEPTELWPDTLTAIGADRWWPLNRLGSRLDAVLRYGLLKAHTLSFGPAARGEAAFRRGGNSLLLPSPYLYKETEHSPVALAEQLAGARGRGLFKPDRYGAVEQIHSLHRVLTTALDLADRVYVVAMPEHSAVTAGFGGYADYAFDKTLNAYREAGIGVLDQRRSIPDRLIRDMAHLVAAGRTRLSQSVAAELAARRSDASSPVGGPTATPHSSLPP
jgi:hypothetical protein